MARTVDPRTVPALLEAAGELFYARGVDATAVRDIADASRLTKPTLYRHFPTKETLIAAYLDERNEHLDAELRAWIGSVPPTEGPRALIEWLCDWISRRGFNGCAFVRAQAELQGDLRVREKARERKRRLFDAIHDACLAAGANDPLTLARQLLLIVEGATTMTYVSGDPAPAIEAARSLGRIALGAAYLAETP